MDSLIFFHSFLVYSLLAVILLNIAISYMAKDFTKSITYIRVGYFTFWAVWAMAVFAGLIVFVFMRAPLNLKTVIMIVVSIILPIIDAYRAIKLKKIWIGGSLGKEFSIKVLSVELIITIAPIMLALS